MAHEISFNNGRAEMAYTGEIPWHGLGTKVDGLQTAQEMLGHAGLLWTVSKQPMYLPSGEVVPEHIALMRDDNAKVLGVASQKYVPIQNAQAGEIVDAIMAEGSAVVEVAGALGNGERCWMLARIPGDFEVTPGDKVKPYFLL
ncbi:MAG: DUF932 domain-containing protein, partial [Nitrososphaera sp.]|nr:DUF932 domain-containing protein [Nitrososphaera sp.]